MRLPSDDPGRPIGALALAAAAVSQKFSFYHTRSFFFQVERGYSLHSSGDYVSDTSDFSSTNWLRATGMYVDKIKNDLTDDNWRAIFNALRQLQESHVREAKVQAGVVLEREPLLPADPPTSPPA